VWNVSRYCQHSNSEIPKSITQKKCRVHWLSETHILKGRSIMASIDLPVFTMENGKTLSVQMRLCFIWAVATIDVVFAMLDLMGQTWTNWVCKRDAFAPGFMVLAGVSYCGKTSPIFINKGITINAKYYRDKVLKQFLNIMFRNFFLEERMIW